MAARERFTKHKVAAALRDAKGMVSVAARALKCDRSTVQRYVDRYPECAVAVTDARELTLDITELALYKAIQEGEGWAVKYMLSTQGKARGYVPAQEVINQGDPARPVVIQHRVNAKAVKAAEDAYLDSAGLAGG